MRLPIDKTTVFSSQSKYKRYFLTGIALALVIASVIIVFLTFGSLGGYQLNTFAMGSYVQQSVYGKEAELAAGEAASKAAALENLISLRRTDSDIQRLNASPIGDFINIDADTYNILKLTLSVSEKSGGAFDPTIAPLSLLWSFDNSPSVPDNDAIQSLLKSVNYRNILLPDDGFAVLKKQACALDLGAAGKGAACDAMISAYSQFSVERAIVSVGGSVGIYGRKPFGDKWNIAIKNPMGEGYLGEIKVDSGFLSTSGNYEKTFIQDGVSYHHILDPETGYPADGGLISVTVICDNGALSDALSTACFVLGMKKSLPLLETFQAEGVFVTRDKQIFTTSDFSFKLINSEFSFRGMLK